MKIFISQGFKNRTREEILRRRERIVEYFQSDTTIITGEYNIEIIDNYTKFIPVELTSDAQSVWCLGDSIRLMAQADLVIFDYDYEKFRGCQIEKEVCDQYMIPHIVLNSNSV